MNFSLGGTKTLSAVNSEMASETVVFWN